MNESVQKAHKLYEDKQWEKARKAYINLIDNYLYEVPVGVILRLAIVQRTLKHYDSCEKTLLLGFEKFPNEDSLMIEYAALANNRKEWNFAVELWEKVKFKSSKKIFSILNYRRYAYALQQRCLEENKSLNDKECVKLKELIEEAFSTHGEDATLKKILDTLKTTEQSKKK